MKMCIAGSEVTCIWEPSYRFWENTSSHKHILEQKVLQEFGLHFLKCSSFLNRPQDVVIFIVGGTTYEEARAVALQNASNSGIRFILGGSAVLNSKRYTELFSWFTMWFVLYRDCMHCCSFAWNTKSLLTQWSSHLHGEESIILSWACSALGWH